MGTLITIVCTDEIAGRARNDGIGHPGPDPGSDSYMRLRVGARNDGIGHPGLDPGSDSLICTKIPAAIEFPGW